jgi:hypothetical protein
MWDQEKRNMLKWPKSRGGGRITLTLFSAIVLAKYITYPFELEKLCKKLNLQILKLPKVCTVGSCKRMFKRHYLFSASLPSSTEHFLYRLKTSRLRIPHHSFSFLSVNSVPFSSNCSYCKLSLNLKHLSWLDSHRYLNVITHSVELWPMFGKSCKHIYIYISIRWVWGSGTSFTIVG